MNNSIFKTDKEDWSKKIFDFTPVEQIGDRGMYFKREDYFAPFGYGNINGAKLRQCIWLIRNHIISKGGGNTMYSAASILSPQLPMSTAVAKHFGFKEVVHVIGATKPETAVSKPMVSLAHDFGADFKFVNVGYNPFIQKSVKDLYDQDQDPKSYYLKYGITVNDANDVNEVYGFHYLGGLQAKNIPDEVETIIVPSGSCNSTISILLGLYLFQPKNLKRVVLIGIGPDKMKLIKYRMGLFESFLGEKVENFYKPNNSDILFGYGKGKIKVDYLNLVENKIVSYSDRFKESYYDISFHPNYEAKVFRYIKEVEPELISSKSMFWIIGSEPHHKITANKKLRVYGN